MSYEDLLNAVNRILSKHKSSLDDRKRRGELYNIFSIVGIELKEICHSAIIADLLNPKGIHGSGEIFLRAFCELIERNEYNFFKDKIFSLNNVVVKTEEYKGYKTENKGGRVDIALHFTTNNKERFDIIIENKIYAKDGENQLLRYKNSTDVELLPIIYLTLDGHKPEKISIGNRDDVSYICMSYRDDILVWLNECIVLSSRFPLVRETIIQYENLIKRLTFQDMDKKMSDELVDLLLDGKNLDLAEQMQGQIGIAKEKFFKEFLCSNWIKEIADKHHLKFDDDTRDGLPYREWGHFCRLKFKDDEKSNLYEINIGFREKNYKLLYMLVVFKNQDFSKAQDVLKKLGTSDSIYKDTENITWGKFFEKHKDWTSKTICNSIEDKGEPFKEEFERMLGIFLDAIQKKS